MINRQQLRHSVVVAALAGAFALGASVALPASAQRAAISAGNVLVANQQSASATIIDIATREATTLEVGAGPHETVISPDGKWGIVTVYGVGGPGGAGNKLAVIDMAAKKVSRTIDLGTYTRPHGAAFVPGVIGQVVVTSETTQNLVLVDILKGEVVAAIPTKHPGSHMLGVTADGKRAFAASIPYGGISEIDLARREFVRDLQVSTMTEGVAVSPDGGTVWLGSNNAKSVFVVDTKTWTVVATIDGLVMPYRVGISPDGALAAFCDPEANRIWIADVRTKKLLGSIDSLASPRGVQIAPDNRTAFVTLGGENAVAAVDLIDRRLKWKAPVGKSPDGVSFGPRP